MSNKDEFFLKQMKGVNPIKKNNKIEREKLKKKDIVIKKNIKIKKKPITINKTNISAKNPNYDLESVNIKKNIKKGFFKIDKKIDFHGNTLLDSEDKFSNTITDCYGRGLRCLLFVTGKGLFKNKYLRDDNKPKLYHGVIRSAFISWVKSANYSKYILSYEVASVEHGGDGAFYVYLRKNK